LNSIIIPFEFSLRPIKSFVENQAHLVKGGDP